MLERFTRETREVVRRAAKITESEQAATDAGARHISPVISSWRLPALLAELGVNVEELRRIASGA